VEGAWIAFRERLDVVERRVPSCPRGEQQYVVAERGIVGKMHSMRVDVDVGNRGLNVVSVQLPSDLGQGPVGNVRDRERGADRQRREDEIRTRADDGDVDAISREVAERESRFQRGDASAADDRG
jgi:hypothetical protein